jgi:aspartate/tyrosine/aromatic aminotransferase
LECSGERKFGDEAKWNSFIPIEISFTGLLPPQTKALAERAHIYMTADGRISMAGLNGKNIDHFAESVAHAVKGSL